MGRSQQTFGKKEKEKKRLKKRQEKLQKKEQRKANSSGGDFESMIAYVDENGMITDTPPDPTQKKEIKAENIEIGVPKKEEEEVKTHFEGRVAFFDSSKGYGFITDLDTQEKYFVHVSGLLDEIQESDKVAFELEKGLKGMNAVRVKRI